MSRREEDQLQRSVLDHLRWRAVDGAFWFHVPNGGWRSPVEAMVFKPLGVTAGVPDLLIVQDGRLFGLELKAEGGRVSEAQRTTIEANAARRRDCRRCGRHRSGNERLEQWRLLRASRSRQPAPDDYSVSELTAAVAADSMPYGGGAVLAAHDEATAAPPAAQRERLNEHLQDVLSEVPGPLTSFAQCESAAAASPPELNCGDLE